MMNCRSCNSECVVTIIPLGQMPLANRLRKLEQLNELEPRYNLEVMLCESCGLVQLKDNISPEQLFDEYLYFSSNSTTMIQSAYELVETVSAKLPENSKVIEIASNDGYLLQHYLKKNIAVLGIEPASNIAEFAIKQGIPTKCDYFTANLAEELVGQNIQADVIHANNVMAHIPDLNDFTLGIKKLLKEDGQAIIEVPYLLNLINHSEFDTIYHEHVFYFSVLPLSKLFSRHKLVISHIEEIPIHGGSLRLFVKHARNEIPSDSVNAFLSKEKELGANTARYFRDFLKRIDKLKEELITLLNSLKNAGNKIVAYGASAKGSTLLNYFGIDHNLIDYIVDRSLVKQGYFMSGTKIPINLPELLLQDNPPYVLLLTWNFAEEILKQQKPYLDRGGKFIIPIPTLQVV